MAKIMAIENMAVFIAMYYILDNRDFLSKNITAKNLAEFP